MTKKYLLEFLSADMRIDRITRVMAADWRAAMARGNLTLHREGRTMTEASVCIHVRNAKTMFSQAVRDDLILFNPFDRLKGITPEPDKNWKHISIDELDKLLDACRDSGWKLRIALCRLAGLRRGEALGLVWRDIDWQNRRITVVAQKTGRRRVTPIEPKLYDLLKEALEQADGKKDLVCSISHRSLWRNFQKIRKRAGLRRWKDAFKVLRRNCETDWAQKYPQYAVSLPKIR